MMTRLWWRAERSWGLTNGIVMLGWGSIAMITWVIFSLLGWMFPTMNVFIIKSFTKFLGFYQRLFFNVKKAFCSSGTMMKYKVRLVAKGYLWVYGRDNTNCFPPTANVVTVRMLISYKQRFVHPLDINNVFSLMIGGRFVLNTFLWVWWTSRRNM